MKCMFAPGCALRKYKPELVEKIYRFLGDRGIAEGVYTTCCKDEQAFSEKVRLIVCCPGCQSRFQRSYPQVEAVSLWKILEDTDFPFPDYHGARMSIHDSCHARGRNSSEMQRSARAVCRRMNIECVEPEHTGDQAVCCGGCSGDYETRRQMALARAAEFTEKDVVVYCTGCARSFSVTDVTPRYLPDLLFGEKTEGLYPPGHPGDLSAAR